MNSARAVKNACLTGYGYSLLGDFMVAEDVAEKRLVQLLPNQNPWSNPSMPFMRNGAIHAGPPSSGERPSTTPAAPRKTGLSQAPCDGPMIIARAFEAAITGRSDARRTSIRWSCSEQLWPPDFD